jgi:hypothetical protein
VKLVVVTLAMFVFAMLLTIVSLPWAVWALGRGFAGDDEGFDRARNAMPVWRWLEYMERRT